jgi:hypothetical protein
VARLDVSATFTGVTIPRFVAELTGEFGTPARLGDEL